jgi:non-specific serine/threonine protein kinase/serine/threonine-protein kinase
MGETMSEEERCPDCGTPHDSGSAPEGFCPQCLLKLAMGGPEVDPPESSHETDPALTETMADEETVSERIADFRLLEKLGEGGMGEVYRAEQEGPIRRTVALKLIKAGMDTKQVVARFESERQALALMNHPNIARVHEAGATDRGRPYFVMEYVKGIPITEYCDKHRLTTNERLGLFAQVCEGVQHAHQKGIIHRDIKPSNVLVGFEDGKPVPKIIDFGVAKATEQRLTERSVFTQMGVLIGTPEYMSPEQAEMTTLDIDTRTDVYSLGVLLYELLVGALPFEPEELRRVAFDEICRKIREEEPSKPSAKVSTLGGASAESARRRRTDPSSLTRELRGDLDWITMKALEKDRTRRYASPSEFAQDIRRHLGHEPVQAGPPGAGYRIRKFVRRHRFGVAAAAVLLGLLVGIAVRERAQAQKIGKERDKARLEAQTAEQVVKFLGDLFSISNPNQARGESISAREVLDRGAERIERELADQPLVRARLMRTIGTAYRDLGLLDSSRPLLEEAHATRQQQLGEDHVATLQAKEALAWLHFRAHEYERARELAEELVETSKRVRGEEHSFTLRAVNLLGVVYLDTQRYDDAEELFASNLAVHRRLHGPDHKAAVTALTNLCMVHTSQQAFDQAEVECREAIDRSKRVYGEDSPQTFFPMWSLAQVHRRLGRIDEAEELHSETLAQRQRVLGEDNPVTAVSMNALASLYLLQGKLDEAEALHRQTLEIRKRVLGVENSITADSMYNLAIVLGRKRKLDEAETLFRQELGIRKRLSGEEPSAVADSMYALGRVLAADGRLGEAANLVAQALELRKRVEDPLSVYTFRTMESLADIYLLQRRFDESESLYLQSMDLLAAAPELDPSEGVLVAYNLACIAAVRSDRATALQRLRQAVDLGFAHQELRIDSDLQELHGDPEFERLASEVDARIQQASATN